MSAKLLANGIKFSLSEIMENVELDKLYLLASEIGEDEEKQKSFVADPSAYALQSVGFVTPDGFHMHVVNERNEYFPPEGNAADQIASYSDSEDQWARIEIRAGKGPKCYVLCGWCPVKEK